MLRAVPDAYLLVVGEGSRREALEAQARELRIAHRVVFTGRRDDVPAVTAALDVAVLPSYREAQGLSILEAMALSRPVVASNVGGIPEMIEDGVTGVLVPPHDAEALAAAIVRLLTDHPLADTLARAGHDLVHDRFCIELMVEAIEDDLRRGRPGRAALDGRSRRLDCEDRRTPIRLRDLEQHHLAAYKTIATAGKRGIPKPTIGTPASGLPATTGSAIEE